MNVNFEPFRGFAHLTFSHHLSWHPREGEAACKMAGVCLPAWCLWDFPRLKEAATGSVLSVTNSAAGIVASPRRLGHFVLIDAQCVDCIYSHIIKLSYDIIVICHKLQNIYGKKAYLLYCLHSIELSRALSQQTSRKPRAGLQKPQMSAANDRSRLAAWTSDAWSSSWDLVEAVRDVHRYVARSTNS